MHDEQVRMWRPGPDDPALCMAGRTAAYRITPRGEYVFGVITDGVMAARRGRRRYLAHPGQVLAWDPSDTHSGTSVDGRPWTARLVVLNTAEVAHLVTGTPFGSPEFPAPVLADQSLYAAFVKMHQGLESPSGRLERDELISEWLHAFLRHHRTEGIRSRRPAALDQQALTQAHEYLRACFERNISLDDLAAAAGTDKFRLVRLFRQHLGLPPHALQIAYRLRRARQLLESGASIAHAATAAGFADQSHLHRHLRRSLGVTPRQYQERFDRLNSSLR